jgi:glycosyltransferase involved in cell wall biosynthesis
MKVSVVVPTLGRRDALASCLDALLEGSVPPAEIVVVDQSQGDAVARLLDERRASSTAIDRLVRTADGLSAARNAGAHATTGDVIAFTDDDCVPAPTWLEALAAAFAGDSRFAAVTGPMLPLPAADSESVAVASRTSTERRVFTGPALPWEVGTGGNTAVRREWLERIGGFDERLGVGTPGQAGEDLDLFRRLLAAEGSILYEPEAVCRHERKSAGERRARRYAYGVGAGAALGRWLRDGDPGALTASARWFALRARLALRSPADEARVLAGTAVGFIDGAARRPWRARQPSSEADTPQM